MMTVLNEVWWLNEPLNVVELGHYSKGETIELNEGKKTSDEHTWVVIPDCEWRELSSNDAVRIVPAATVIGIGWDITGARYGGEEDGEGGEGIHESSFGRM